ncbi:DUF5133 domain-containing protein [Streptomyces sp. NPDC058274]|jgi:hypothetical protein|uniref:DUF5133 domain-containing protein n=1 Tax=Streptomyces sp. NPDC058274 TaxID=3346416 RepID=UPI0036F0F09B
MPDPRRVRTLLARYASARIALEEKSTPAWQQELEDVTYTLCVLTGARSIADAIAAADEILERHAQGQREVTTATAGEDTALAA